MAEGVESRLESFIPSFEELVSINLFTQKEIKSVIKKRKAFEYTLLSKSVKPDNFLKYIEYEAAFKALLDERKEKIGDTAEKRLIVDIDWPKHVHSIFRRATGQFPSDLSLWRSYFRFCQDRGDLRSLKIAFQDCLKRHSRNPDIYIEIADWEMRYNSDPETAREIMQQGIVSLEQCPKVYCKYAETIIFFSKMIIERREVQGIEEYSDINKAPNAIFKSALDKLVTGKKELVQLFIDLYKKYELDTGQIIDMASNIDDVDVISYIARLKDDPISYFKTLIEESKNNDLMISFADYLIDVNNIDELINLVNNPDIRFTDEEASKIIDALIKFNKIDDAEEMLVDGETTQSMKESKLKIIDAKSNSIDDFKSKSSDFLNENYDNRELFSLFVRLVARRRPDFEKWSSFIYEFIPKIDPNEIEKIFQFSRALYKTDDNVKLIQSLLPILTPTSGFIKVATEIYRDSKCSDDQIRMLHELCVNKFGRVDTEAWLEYCTFEYNKGNLQKLERVRQRASNALENGADFTRAYRELFCKND